MDHFEQWAPVTQCVCIIAIAAVVGIAIWSFFKMLRGL